MEETKIIKAVFGGGTYTVTNKRTRTDYGQVLEIIGIDLPDTFECIFSNSNTSAGVGKKMIGSAQRVLIPDEYLATGQTIYAWILLHDTEDDGRHMYSIRIPVADMPDTSPEEPTPVEQSIISQAITALNSAVTTTTQKAQEATESADRAEQAAEGVEGYAERAEAAQGAAESARDIALEAKVSAQASAATASEKASEAISSATTASQSALTAENASESAQEYASASAESASQASQSAESASESASASAENALFTAGKALDASNSASEASQSASTAVQAKTDAETAKTASQTAQGLAETARNEAVTAKTGAESARDEAQSIADGITGKVEQIDSNTDRIESLEDDRYKPYPTDTASGSIASFSDGADGIPLKSCIVQIDPVQDLHGYDSPWPAGGGKNLIIPSDRSFTNNGVPCVCSASAETVSLKGTATNSGGRTAKMTNDIILPAGEYMLSVTAVSGTKQGQYIVNKTDGNTYLSSSRFSLEEETSVYVGANVSNGTVYDEVVHIQIESGSTATAWTPYENICPISGWTGCEVRHSGEDTSNPTTYPITFPTEAGTIYGGYIDPINGELVVTHQIKTFDGTENWSVITDTNKFYINMSLNDFDVYDVGWISDKYPYGGYINNSGNINIDHSFYTNHNVDNKLQDRIFVFDTSFADVEDFKSSLVANPLTVYGMLKEPIHYPLTPQEIKTLLGQNNIWADTGDTEVEYRADITLYINKKIAEAISALT